MKKLLLLLLWQLLLLQAAPAATVLPTSNAHSHAVTAPQPRLGKKPTKLQKLAVRLLQKKLVKQAVRTGADKQKTKDTIANLALASGIAAIICVFILPALALLLIPAAIVLGIMGISNNPNRKTRLRALIGLILGIALTVLTAIVAVIFATSGFY